MGGITVKYRARMAWPGIEEGTVFYPVKNEYGVNIYHPSINAGKLYLLHQEDMMNSYYFEPISERLTSDEEDEAARRYMWVPKKGSNVTFLDSALRHRLHNWSGSMSDWYWFRCGMIFRYLDEAERAAELMRNGQK